MPLVDESLEEEDELLEDGAVGGFIDVLRFVSFVVVLDDEDELEFIPLVDFFELDC